jgi:hypothetical protein
VRVGTDEFVADLVIGKSGVRVTEKDDDANELGDCVWLGDRREYVGLGGSELWDGVVVIDVPAVTV